MEGHKNILNRLCRTCANFLEKRVYPASQFTAEIQRVFNVDITLDDPAIFPMKICVACERKLTRCKNQPDKSFLQQELPYFETHDERDCNTCKTKKRKTKLTGFSLKVESASSFLPDLSARSLLQEEEILSLEDIKDIAEQNHLLVLASSNTDLQLGLPTVTSAPVVLMYVSVRADLKWTFNILENTVDVDELIELPQTLDRDTANYLFSKLSKARLCCGNADFPHLVTEKFKMGTALSFEDNQGEVKARIEGQYFQQIDQDCVIRSVDCKTLVFPTTEFHSNRCESCTEHRKTLNRLEHRRRKRVEDNMGTKPQVAHMTRESLEAKSRDQAKEKKLLRQEVKRLSAKIEQSVSTQGVSVSPTVNDILTETIQKKSPFPEGSPMALLWDQQSRMASLKSRTSMRWHPMIVRWSLSIYLNSPSTYKRMRNSGNLLTIELSG